MRNNSTLKDKKIIKKEVKASAKTLDFLKMFARSYKVEESLPYPINEVYVN